MTEITEAPTSTTTITKVRHDGDYYSVTGETGWSIGIPDNLGIVPKVGQTLEYFGNTLGYIRGVRIDGVVAWYRTEAEQAAFLAEQQVIETAKKQAFFEEHEADFYRRIAQLPAPFKERVTAFLQATPTFGRDFLPYELFVCEQAVEIGKSFKTIEALDEFYGLTYDQQLLLVPNLAADHSGNTFGAACMLAKLAMRDDALEIVPKMHGALCPLVGCAAYGCHAARKTTAPSEDAGNDNR